MQGKGCDQKSGIHRYVLKVYLQPQVSPTRQVKKPERSKDWKQWEKKGWRYKGLNDPEYIKDRDTLFRRNGNGWWGVTGASRGRGQPVDNSNFSVENPNPPLKKLKGWVLKYLNT